MELNLKKIDWRLPPHELKANIDGNFTQLSFVLKSLREELDSSASKLECEDDNFIVTEPVGTSLIYKLRLNSTINVSELKSNTANLKNLHSDTAEFKSIKAGLATSDDKEFSIDGIVKYNKEHKTVTIGVEDELANGPYQKTRLRLAPKKDTSAFHSLVIQSHAGARRNMFQDESTHMVVKGDGSVGIGVFHKLGAKLTIAGEGPLLCLKTPMTPKGKDSSSSGTISWDDDYLYVKTADGWKKAKLDIL